VSSNNKQTNKKTNKQQSTSCAVMQSDIHKAEGFCVRYTEPSTTCVSNFVTAWLVVTLKNASKSDEINITKIQLTNSLLKFQGLLTIWTVLSERTYIQKLFSPTCAELVFFAA
jgi:hypothetical protein